jgi:hypothetical protein
MEPGGVWRLAPALRLGVGCGVVVRGGELAGEWQCCACCLGCQVKRRRVLLPLHLRYRAPRRTLTCRVYPGLPIFSPGARQTNSPRGRTWGGGRPIPPPPGCADWRNPPQGRLGGAKAPQAGG